MTNTPSPIWRKYSSLDKSICRVGSGKTAFEGAFAHATKANIRIEKESSQLFKLSILAPPIIYLFIYPKIIEEPHFECVRLRRTHSKCELYLNFRIVPRFHVEIILPSISLKPGENFG